MMLFLCPLRLLRPDTGYNARSHLSDPGLPGNALLPPDAISCHTDVQPRPKLFSVLAARYDIQSFTLLPAGILTLVPSLLPSRGLLDVATHCGIFQLS